MPDRLKPSLSTDKQHVKELINFGIINGLINPKFIIITKTDMKKLITLLLVSSLYSTWATAQENSSIEKPEILTEREKLDPRKHEAEVMGALKEGRITREEAQKKLAALSGEMEKKGEFKRPKRPVKPELSDTVKDSLAEIKSDQQQLHDSMKAKLADLGESASKEDMRDAIETFKAENKEKFDAIKQAHEAIRESIESARPEKPERPELNA